MAQRKGKIIKRIYEEGRERTVLYKKKRAAPKKRPEAIPVSAKSAPSISQPSSVAIQERPQVRHAVYEPEPAPVIAKERPYVDHQDLPSSYNVTRLTLLAKDPFWIYAYWEIAPHSIEALRREFSPEEIDNAAYVLRMYDVSCIDFNGFNANSSFDIEVGRQASNWYINLWYDNVSYVGDLGLRTPSGRFLTLARSNFVRTPRMSYSQRSEQIWMKVTDEKFARPYVVGQRVGKKKARFRGAKPAEPSIKITQISAQKKKSKVIYLTEDDIRKYYGSISPLLRQIIKERLRQQLGVQFDGTQWYLLEGESEEDRGRLFSMLPKAHQVRRLILGSSQELIISGGASEQLVQPGGSSDFMPKKRQRSFFFELNTELIVYGRTEPDAEVWLGDKRVSLRSDGTFSMRFALPDGHCPLEFNAISADKLEERRIHTYVDRNTIYRNLLRE